MHLRRAQKRAAHRGDIEAADLGKHIHDIVCLRLHPRDRSIDDLLFAGKAGIVHPAAAPYGFLRGQMQKAGKNRAGRGGIADAHFADADHIHAVLRRTMRRRAADFDGAQRLSTRHRRFTGDVFCALRDLTIVYAGADEIRVDTDIGDVQLRIVMLRQHRHAGQPARKIDGLRQRYRLRRGGDPLLHHAVIRCEDQYAPLFRTIDLAARNARPADGNFLQHAQTFRRLRQRSLPRRRPFHRFGVQRADLYFIGIHGIKNLEISILQYAEL